MTVFSKKDAWAEADKIFPTDYIKDELRSERAGYDIYVSTVEGVNAWISDLGTRLEININEKSQCIWIAKKKTLEEIIASEKECRTEGGIFGIAACKDAIKATIGLNTTYGTGTTSLYGLLEEYVNRANSNICFNKAMILACWELINEKGEEL